MSYVCKFHRWLPLTTFSEMTLRLSTCGACTGKITSSATEGGMDTPAEPFLAACSLLLLLSNCSPLFCGWNAMPRPKPGKSCSGCRASCRDSKLVACKVVLQDGFLPSKEEGFCYDGKSVLKCSQVILMIILRCSWKSFRSFARCQESPFSIFGCSMNLAP